MGTNVISSSLTNLIQQRAEEHARSLARSPCLDRLLGRALEARQSFANGIQFSRRVLGL